GDSRLYAFVGGDLIPLTQDDSLVHQMLSSGLITAEQALHHPQKNILTQTLGQQPPPTPHVARTPLKKGAAYLLCTDGLFGALSREEIINLLLRQDLTSPQAKVEALIEQANQNGGYDNITAILIQPPTKSATFAGRMNLKLPPQKYLIGGGIAIIVVAILIGVFVRRTNKSSEEIIIMDSDTNAAVADGLSNGGTLPKSMEEEMLPPPSEPTDPPSEAPLSSETPSPSKSSKATATASAAAKTDKASEKKTTFDYTIQKGDNLGKIAEVFGVSLADLRRVNGLKDDKIQEGKKLKIPVKAVHHHTVKEKETLSAIARKYDTRVEVIKRANGMDDEKIRPGQKLIIPVVKK
ncbi:MAG: LysM peptidoglycan-binding domain-containing protein, partial [Candidatus Methanosuratincola sp.]